MKTIYAKRGWLFECLGCGYVSHAPESESPKTLLCEICRREYHVEFPEGVGR